MIHTTHIPVMGTSYTIDTPIRIAPFGIDSTISLVDNYLLEDLRAYYSRLYNLPYEPILRNEEDGCAKRVQAYLDMVHTIVCRRFEEIRRLPFEKGNEKEKYFTLLPSAHALRKGFESVLKMPLGAERSALEASLNSQMYMGSIDVNLMVKLDYKNVAKDALRGFAHSKITNGAVVFSAGVNLGLFNDLVQYSDFYRTKDGIKKRIILKISDYRSALTQGKFLAKKGLEVSEFRVESGLNCGGHAFASQGMLLPLILEELKEKRESLSKTFYPLIKKYYDAQGMDSSVLDPDRDARFTVQGGIGNSGENRRMLEYYKVYGTGWGSAFLMVPEACLLDDYTLEILRDAKREDLYLSDASPIGVPFNNTTRSTANVQRVKNIEAGSSGFPCVNGFLRLNTEFTEEPICTASIQYQKLKIAQIQGSDLSPEEKQNAIKKVQAKECICSHLGNPIRIAFGIVEASKAPVSVCPGPTLAYFKGPYSLVQMMAHIYGDGPSLVPSDRPHLFAEEIRLYTEWFIKESKEATPEYAKWLHQAALNLYDNMDYCLNFAKTQEAFPGENLASIGNAITLYRPQLEKAHEGLKAKHQNLS
jgi:hypothetical protein